MSMWSRSDFVISLRLIFGMPSHPGTPHFLGSSLFLPKHCSTFYLWIFRTYSHSSTAHSRKGFITLWLIRAKAQKGKGGNLNDYVRKRKKLFFLPSTSLLNHAATRVKCNQESSSWKYTKQLRVPSGLSMLCLINTPLSFGVLPKYKGRVHLLSLFSYFRNSLCAYQIFLP